MNINEISSVLSAVPSNYKHRNGAELREVLRVLKAEALEHSNQAQAKKIWCLEQVLEVQTLYVSAFADLKNKSYYAAWCDLERIEITLGHLAPHFSDQWSTFWLGLISQHIKQLQSLFPYRIFLSPEMVYKEMVCTICRKPISIRNSCGHRTGEIYNGELCGREITKIESFAGVSLVTNPVQKYSVVFPSGQDGDQKTDTYDYSAVRYVIDRLDDPFDEWEGRWTKIRHPHERFKGTHTEGSECPCESGELYKDCCWGEPGVLRPHLELHFNKSPKLPTGSIEYF